MIDPKRVCLFIPHGLKDFKFKLFERIGSKVGSVCRGHIETLARLPDEIVPVVGCTPALRPLIEQWRRRGRRFIYWDRGYLRRVFATWLPNGHDLGVPGGYYRWHINAFQMGRVHDVPADRWRSLRLDAEVKPFRKQGKHIVLIDVGPDYWKLHADMGWIKATSDYLRQHTDRPIIVRDKESKIPLNKELEHAHALVTHGSVAAVESIVMGCPVFVHPDSAAASMGLTDFSQIETPVYPDDDARMKWLYSLAYHQWNEDELCNGVLWRMIK